MSLYQKYRPQTFDEVIGNTKNIKSLVALLDKADHPHVFLLTGPSGTGKTTIGRIIAKNINAEIIEVNSANNRGIDTARDIIENIQYASMDGRPIMYLLDECHKWSADMSNAMLKPLEDCPSHIYFVLCTTNPEKIINAIKTRCTEISMAPLSDDDMFSLLRKVSKAEGKKIPVNVYEAIMASSEGSPRLALVNLEKVLYLDSEEDMLIAINQNSTTATIDLCRALLNEEFEWEDIAKIINGLETTDWESIRYAVLGYMSSVVLKNAKKRAVHVIENFSEPFYNTNKAGLVLACYKTVGR